MALGSRLRAAVLAGLFGSLEAAPIDKKTFNALAEMLAKKGTASAADFGIEIGDDEIGSDLKKSMSAFTGQSFGGEKEDKEEMKTSVCQPGKHVVPKMDLHQRLSANGCGPEGLQIPEKYGLYRCCNIHDVCFSVCGTTHEFCEQEFSRCMDKVCEKPLAGKPKACHKKAKSFAALTMSFGKSFFITSQGDNCNCLSEEKAKKRHHRYLLSFYKKYKPEFATNETVKEVLEEWQGKEGQLYLNLVKEYGSQFVRFKDIQPEFYRDEL